MPRFQPNAHPTALVWLTIIGLVNSAVASYYYLRLIVVMYMREPVIAEAPAPASGAMKLALVLAAIATIYLGRDARARSYLFRRRRA